MYRKSLYFMVALVLPLLAVNPVLGGDKDPPTPDPAMFSSVPSAVSSSAISMTATTGSDASPPIEYYFDETSGNFGGTDSGWQAFTAYTDTGLNASTQYTYTVQMRDNKGNVGTASSPANATTDVETPGRYLIYSSEVVGANASNSITKI